jgi:hypothetical protein
MAGILATKIASGDSFYFILIQNTKFYAALDMHVIFDLDSYSFERFPLFRPYLPLVDKAIISCVHINVSGLPIVS